MHFFQLVSANLLVSNSAPFPEHETVGAFVILNDLKNVVTSHTDYKIISDKYKIKGKTKKLTKSDFRNSRQKTNIMDRNIYSKN